MQYQIERQPDKHWTQLRKQNKKIGILGGTFNPPHNTHVEMAKSIYKEFQLDLILLLPTGQPPHKKDEEIAPRVHREQMLRIIAKEYPFMEVCTIEMDRPGITYTVDSLRFLRENLGENIVFYYIIGTDTLLLLETWKDYLDVFAMTEFICVFRPGDEKEQVAEKISYYQSVYGKKIQLASYRGQDLSSSGIRARLWEGKSVAGMVPKQIEEYIEQNGVYTEKRNIP